MREPPSCGAAGVALDESPAWEIGIPPATKETPADRAHSLKVCSLVLSRDDCRRSDFDAAVAHRMECRSSGAPAEQPTVPTYALYSRPAARRWVGGCASRSMHRRAENPPAVTALTHTFIQLGQVGLGECRACALSQVATPVPVLDRAGAHVDLGTRAASP